MKNGGSLFLAVAVGTAIKAGWTQYQQWRLDQIPQDERAIYQRMWAERSQRWYRSPYLWASLALLFVFVGGMLVSGCASTMEQSNAAGGVIGMNFNMSQTKALAQANSECAKYGKAAKSDGVNEVRNSLRYSCVTP